MDQWNPGIRVKILPGPTAERYGWVMLGSSLMLFASAGVLVIGMLATGEGYLDHPVTLVAMIAMIACVFSSLVSWGLHVKKRNAEFRAGYTTTDAQEHAEVDLRSGQIIRLAGEGLLRSAEYRRRLTLVRNDAIEGSPSPNTNRDYRNKS